MVGKSQMIEKDASSNVVRNALPIAGIYSGHLG